MALLSSVPTFGPRLSAKTLSVPMHKNTGLASLGLSWLASCSTAVGQPMLISFIKSSFGFAKYCHFGAQILARKPVCGDLLCKYCRRAWANWGRLCVCGRCERQAKVLWKCCRFGRGLEQNLVNFCNGIAVFLTRRFYV